MKSLLAGIGSFFLSISIFQYMRISGVIFNTGVILAVLVTQLGGFRKGLLATLSYAVLVDLFASRLLGIHLLIYTPTVIVLSKMSEEMYEESIILPVILLTFASFLYSGMYYLITLLFGMAIPFGAVVRTVLMEYGYTLSFGMFLYSVSFRIVKGYPVGKKNV